MCGLVAVLSWNAPPADEDVARALDAIAHRGPDGRGIWRSADRRAQLGHVRLAVRDLEGGAQPLVSEDGRVVAVVNGELYSARELRAELEAEGHRFATRSDSELVVHAWEQWGRAMLPRLRGEFAFVLWDDRDRILFAARDRFGVKPLAWAEARGRVMLASQARALFALGIPAAWDHASLFQAASFQYAPPDRTLFAGVHELPAGHALLVRDGHARVERYWDLDHARRPRWTRTEEETVTAFRERFDDAVRERLSADVPVACQLSGGLDSSAVLASATQARGGPIDAFTVSFVGGEAYDEEALARDTAAHLHARHHVVPVSDADVADHFADAVVAGEGACINAHAAAKLLLSRAIRRAGFKVVLTGEGADEVLLGYAHLRSDLEGTARRVATSNTASSGLMLPDGDGLCTAAVERALGWVPTWISAKATLGKRLHALVRDDWRAGFGDRDPGRTMLASFDLAGQVHGREPALQSAYLWTKLALEGYILRTLGDGLEMASGVEGRLPMLDDVLFDLLRDMPTTAKIRGGLEKWVLREAMHGRLPGAVLQREKHPFLAPPMGPRTFAVARDVLASASFRSQPLFDPAKIATWLDDSPTWDMSTRKANDPVLFFALSIAVLHARFGVSS